MLPTAHRPLHLLIICTVALVMLRGTPARAVDATQAHPVTQFLDADGRFDFDAARRSGYEGPLDLGSLTAQADPVTGGPVFEPASSAPRTAGTASWSGAFASGPVVDTVYALAVYKGLLVVGGRFVLARG